ncbi:MAG: translocation/assembly module TamB domain-containing protein [Polyangiaceae bacterium]
MATVKSRWTGDLVQRIGSETDGSESVPFELSADVNLERFPLGIIPVLVENQIRGPLSGKLQLRGLGANARLTGSLDGSDIMVNRVRLPRLTAKLRATDGEIEALVEAQQPTGAARVELKTAATWGRHLIPHIEPRADVRLRAERFQLEAVAPLLMSYVSTLEGEMDADFAAHLDEAFPQLSGTASLRDGVVQVPQVGQRFSDVRANLSVRDGRIQLDSFQARGLTGRISGRGSAKLKGFSLESAEARLDIKESEKLPVTYEGVVIGDAWGEAKVNYVGSKAQNSNELDVSIPRFHLEMPEVAGNGVQDLEPAKGVRVGAHRADGKFVIVPLAPLESSSSEEEPTKTMRIRVRLGQSVWIERGRQVSVQLAGRLEIDTGAEQKVDGRIELKGGKLDVSGKRFEIERGVVTFEGNDVSNPTITATARWDSPADYVVYADYAGTVENGKLNLRSEPVLTQNEILSLLLFGSPEGNLASGNAAQSQQSNTAAGAGAAVSVAGGTATKGLNRALSDVTSLDVSTRIDTSTGSSRPELVVQITPRLTTRLTRTIGAPAPGQSPDMTFLTLELRIKRAWSVSAVVGDRGSSTVDLIWRKRY